MMKINAYQVFMLFFAIFWSAVANVQPRWKPFQFPLMLRFGHVFRRVVLAVLVLNILPILYFGLVLWCLYRRDSGTELAAFEVVVRGVVFKLRRRLIIREFPELIAFHTAPPYECP